MATDREAWIVFPLNRQRLWPKQIMPSLPPLMVKPLLGGTEQLSEQTELVNPAQYRVIPCRINFVAADPQLLHFFC
jgi:hypothetical protein